MAFVRVYLRCGPCHDRYPNGRPVLVGAAWLEEGVWWSFRYQRVGQGVTPDGARTVEENIDRIPMLHERTVATDYRCSQKGHSVGLDEDTLRWALDKAVERGEPALYLPLLSDDGRHPEDRPSEAVAGEVSGP